MKLSADEWLTMLHKNACLTRQKTNEEIVIYVNVWREDEPVCTMMSPDRDSALRCAQLACVGMLADRIALTFEGWYATDTTNPDTGEEWRSGEMQQYIEAHPVNEVIKEGIYSQMITRDGEEGARASEFIAGEHNAVFKDISEPEDTGGGYILEQLREFMAEPKLDELMSKEGVDIAEVEQDLGGHEIRMYHQDRGVIRELANGGSLVGILVFAAPGSEREQMLNKQLNVENSGEVTTHHGAEFLNERSD